MACFRASGVPGKLSRRFNATFRGCALVFLGFGRYKPGFHLYLTWQGAEVPFGLSQYPPYLTGVVMKVRNSLKSLRSRHRDNRVVRRKGRVYVINKTHRRFKARQG